jgi:hypothetical protein
LLTRGTGDVRKKLQDFAMTDLFDSIEQIPPTAPKSRFISQPKSIFIDDSFAERKEVSNHLGIPTFAPDMLECLISDKA